MGFIEKIQKLKADYKAKQKEAELREIEDTEHKIKLLEARKKVAKVKAELEQQKQKVAQEREKLIEKGGLLGLGSIINEDALDQKSTRKKNKEDLFKW